MPVWPGVDELADALQAAGAEPIDPHVPASGLIAQAALVLATAAGSIVAEGGLSGHRPVCVLVPGAEAQFGPELAEFDVVTCRYDEFAEAVRRAERTRPGAGTFGHRPVPRCCPGATGGGDP
jgi:hypothetical protein